MKKFFRYFTYLLLVFIIITINILGFTGTAWADAPMVTLSSLAPGTVVNFVGYNWIVLDPAAGYLLMQDNYSSQRYAYGAEIDFRNVFDPSNSNNIGYYLNNLNPDPYKFSGTGFYQRIWNSYPDYKSLIIDHAFDIYSVGLVGQPGGLVSTATTHIGLLSYSEWKTYSKYYNPGSGILDNPSAPFWTINPWFDGTTGSLSATADLYVSTGGGVDVNAYVNSMGVRPTLYLNPNALIIGGNVTYYLAGTLPIVTGISPTQGPLTGGTQVTLTGYNFTGATGVSFGDAAASFTINNDNTITATAPAQAAGTVHVTVTSANGTSNTYPNDQFTYVPVPAVTGVSPASGLVSGGAAVTITGSGFTYATGVSFGGMAAASFTVNSDTRITATSPAHVTGMVDVIVTSTGGTSTANANDRFEYGQTAVTGLSQVAGPTSGGTIVTITGRLFTEVTGVSFGGTAAASFTVDTDTSITAVSPAQAAGTVDVTVTSAGGTSAVSSADEFTYSGNQLVGWWKLGEGSGTAAADSSGYGYNGTLTDPDWSTNHTPDVSNQINASLNFGGVSQFSAPLPTVLTKNISISAWVKWNGTTGVYQPIAYIGEPGASGYGLILDTGGNLNIVVAGRNWQPTAMKLPVGVWAHLAAVEDGSGNWTVYLNGSQAGQVSSSPYTPTGTMLVGYAEGVTNTPTWFHGLIDDVRVYTAALTQAQVLQLVAVPAVSGVTPASGHVGGGTTVTVTGVNFAGATGVSFGGVAATSFTVVSDTSITAVSPAHSAGNTDVTVTNAYGTSAGGSGSIFTYYPSPVVTGVSPASGSLSGGTSVTISGSGFTAATGVYFGGMAATSFTVNSDTSITAASPAQAAGTVDIIVTTPGGTSVAAIADEFTYSANDLAGWWKLGEGAGTVAADSSGYGYNGTLTNPDWSTNHTPDVSNQINASLNFSGGNSQFSVPLPTVLTENVSISAWVKWNGTTGTYQPIAYNGDPGANGYGLFLDPGGKLNVLLGGCAWLATAATLPVNAWAHVAAVEDGSGKWNVYLNGVHVSQVTGVPKTPSGNFLIGYANNATTTPTCFPGLIDDVRIYISALTAAQVQQLVAVPVVSGITPASGHVSGGTPVTVTGVNFTGATGVSFGGVAATSFTIVSDTTITAVSPAHSAGNADVTMTNTYGTSAGGSSSIFSYYPSPVVTGVSPASGPAGGGTTVTISGSGFTGATGVSFGGIAATSFTVVSDTTITAVSPAHSAGNADVTVTTPGGTSSTGLADQFTYNLLPGVTGITPASGNVSGGTTVTITGYYFTGSTGVSFGGTSATSFTVNSDTSITATAPAHANGTAEVTVTNAYGTSTGGLGTIFTYFPSPEVTGISPAGGSAGGGTEVTITGCYFTGATGVSFGGTAASSFTVNSDTSITAAAPAHATGTVDVTITTPGGTSSAGQFTYSTNELAGWWKLGEGSGTTAVDWSGYGHHGTVTSPLDVGSPPYWVNNDYPNSIDRVGGCVDFSDGQSSFTAPVPTTATGSVSISAWVKWNGTTWGDGSTHQPIAYNGTLDAGNGYGLALTNLGYLEVISGGDWLATATKLTPNTWQHVAGVEDGSGKWTVYLNGTQVGQVNTTPATPTGYMYIGYLTVQNTMWKFPGRIDNVRIYTTALTAAQVQQLAATFPVVTSVSPTSGSTAGGTTMTITGSGFTGATGISFGGTAATSFTVNSDTSITAASPAHATGTVDVTVTTTLGGTSATSANDRFTYTPPPVTTGTISGIVIDGSHNPISGANISLTISGNVYSAQTTADGTYSILDIPAGTGYTVTASKAGYNSESATNVSVTANTTTSGVNITLTAIPSATHTVSISGNPAAGGNVTGGGIYNEGTPVTVTASVYSGYTFTNWTEGGSPVSTDVAYTFTLGTSDRTLVANFIVTPPDITTGTIAGTVTDGTNPVSGATVSLTVSGSVYSATTLVNGSYSILNVPAGTGYTVTASKSGYTSGSATNVSVTANTTTSGVNITLTAVSPATHTVSVSANPAAGGNVAGSGTYSEGASVTVTATANSGYTFTNWTEGGSPVSTGTAYTFTLGTSDRNLAANFTVTPPDITTGTISGAVTDGANPISGATVSLTVSGSVYSATTEDNGSYSILNVPAGTGYTVTASKTGYTSGSATNVSVTANTTTSGVNITLTAVSSATHTVSVSADPAAGGSVTGGGTYNEGASVTVTATANSGYTFVNWTEGGSPVSTDASYTFTLGTAGRNLIANFSANPTYTVTFDSQGGGLVTGINNVSSGSTISAPTAPIRSGYTFGGWHKEASCTNAWNFNVDIVTGNIILYAGWIYNGGGGGGNSGGGGGGSSTPAPTPVAGPTAQVLDSKGNVSGSVNLKLDSKTGIAAVEVNLELLNSAFDKSAADDKEIRRVVIDIPEMDGAKAYETVLPASFLSAGDASKKVEIKTGAATVKIQGNMLNAAAAAGAQNVSLTIAAVDRSKLDVAVQSQIGDRPVIELNLKLDGKQTDWSNPNAPVTVSIPYTPTAEELANPESIVIWYIDGNGKAVSVPNGRYNPVTGTVAFATTHFSYYAVGYNKVSFSDVAIGAWYNKAVGFIAARGITSGTGNGNYSPEAKLTRGEFIVLLMRAYGIAPDTDLANNFSDAGNTYYTGYLAAAKRLGISGGVGNNMYAPGNEITRQEMFTLLYNVLKVIDQLPQGSSGKTLSDFTDAGQINSWAKEAMTLLVKTGTVGGSSGRLTPTRTTTRAEMAQVLYNLLEK